jgi:hypothetical protein
MTHAHLTSIVLTFILFTITILLQSQGKKIKFWQIGLRASYLLMLGTGFMLLLGLYKITLLYIIKAVVGVIIIGLFEMAIGWKAKGKPLNPIWIMFAITFIALMYLGLKLPMGLYYF